MKTLTLTEVLKSDKITKAIGGEFHLGKFTYNGYYKTPAEWHRMIRDHDLSVFNYLSGLEFQEKEKEITLTESSFDDAWAKFEDMEGTCMMGKQMKHLLGF